MIYSYHRDTEFTERIMFDPIPTEAGLDTNPHPFGKDRDRPSPRGTAGFNLFRGITHNKLKPTSCPCPPCLCGDTVLFLSKTILLVVFLSVLWGCGYQLAGRETHVPPDVTSLAIPTFQNETLEPGIEVPLTQSFLREFMFDGRVKVRGSKEADTILEGKIKTYRIQSVSYNQSGLVMEYQVLVTVDLTLTKPSGEILWKEDNLTEARWYRASFGGVLNEASKNSAVQEIGKFMAERVKNRFFYNF